MATEMKRSPAAGHSIEELLGDEARSLLDHKSQGIPKEQIQLPGPDFIDRVVAHSDRSPSVLRSLQALVDHGRLAGDAAHRRVIAVDDEHRHFSFQSIERIVVEHDRRGADDNRGEPLGIFRDQIQRARP